LINETQQEEFGLEVMAANITCDGVYESEVWAVGLKVSVSICMKCYFLGSSLDIFFNFRDFQHTSLPDSNAYISNNCFGAQFWSALLDSPLFTVLTLV
jgi:hypothetical protein